MSIVLSYYVVEKLFKSKARKLRAEQNVKLNEALNLVSREYGFLDWRHLQKAYDYEYSASPCLLEMDHSLFEKLGSPEIQPDETQFDYQRRSGAISWYAKLGYAYRVAKQPISKDVIQFAIDVEHVLDHPSDYSDDSQNQLVSPQLIVNQHSGFVVLEDQILDYYAYRRAKYPRSDNDPYDFTSLCERGVKFYRLISPSGNSIQELYSLISDEFFHGPESVWLNGVLLLDGQRQNEDHSYLLIEPEYCQRYEP